MCKLVALCSTYDIIIIIINSYIALYPQKLYELMALYIININIHWTIKKKCKYYVCELRSFLYRKSSHCFNETQRSYQSAQRQSVPENQFYKQAVDCNEWSKSPSTPVIKTTYKACASHMGSTQRHGSHTHAHLHASLLRDCVEYSHAKIINCICCCCWWWWW